MSKTYSTAERLHRFPTDAKIRSHGYTIESRPKDGEPTWRKGDGVYTETEVLCRIADEGKGKL